VYWTYFTPEEVNRGHHAHHELQQVLVAVSGRITVKTESPTGKDKQFTLERPNVGLYLPRMCWHEMSYSHNAVQVCIASMEYSESDYIRDYADFKRIAANAGIN
jgi:dTDP-4-dehydrorhamnose 3,5-epimerase-like enzyme